MVVWLQAVGIAFDLLGVNDPFLNIRQRLLNLSESISQLHLMKFVTRRVTILAVLAHYLYGVRRLLLGPVPLYQSLGYLLVGLINRWS